MSNIELELHWIVYPGDYDQDSNPTDIRYTSLSDALEDFHALGEGTELWCDPMLTTYNDLGRVEDIDWSGIIFIATNKEME